MRLACFPWIGAVSRYPLTALLQRYQTNILRHPPGRFMAAACCGYGLMIFMPELWPNVRRRHLKEAVLALGKAIAAGAQYPPEPTLVKLLPLEIDAVWKLRVDRLSFFRSHLVLNSIYYLSHENILDLDLSAEAVSAPYQYIPGSGDPKRSQFLLVQYENPERARQALNRFHDAYLPGHKKEITAETAADSPSLFKLEDGWMAYKLIGKYIAIVFESPDPESARAILQKNESNLLKKGGGS